MNILLIYATNSGGTYLCSQIIQDVLSSKGHTVETKNVRSLDPSVMIPADLIIVGSPSWDYQGLEGQVHEDYRPFMEKAKTVDIAGKKFAVYGLGDSSYTQFCGCSGHLEEFVESVNGKRIGETLRIDSFYYNQVPNEQRVREWAEHLSSLLS